MTMKFLRAAVGAAALLAAPAAAQTVGGTAYGTYVNTLGVTSQSPVATLPTSGGMAVGEAPTFGVTGAVDARWLTAIATGAVDDPASSAQSTSEVEQVSVLAGVITADVVTAIASSYRTATGAASDAEGSSFANLVVNGTAITSDVAPNTRIDLPGLGYVILNEQASAGDGVTTSGMTVNMIHVFLTDGGEIIVGSATTSVSS